MIYYNPRYILVGFIFISYTFLPLTVAAQYGINVLINGRNCYELINRSSIPKKEKVIRFQNMAYIFRLDPKGVTFCLPLSLCRH